jgi:iron complex transport system substrate-binding protein
MELDYATQFTVDKYQDGSALVTIAGQDRYLIVPEGAEPNETLSRGAAVIAAPVENLYLAASSAMDLFRALDELDRVTMTSTTAENWSIPEIREAVEREDILYVGKYSAPDYEVVLDEGCGLCVESTMIYHTPEVKEQLERLGIPVMVERSSYEPHPLGRMEWIKRYGLLTGKEQEAEAFFQTQAEQFQNLSQSEGTGKQVAFFYLTPNGAANVRKSSDYVAKLIELAGGSYAFSDLAGEEENALSTMNLQMEAFYAAAKDADVLIYNSTVDGGVESLKELLGKSGLLAHFRAVKEGNVWCTRQNLFQQPTGVCGLLEDFHRVFTEETGGSDQLNYLFRLK